MNTIDLEIRPLARKCVSKDPWLLEDVTAEGIKDSYQIIAAVLLASGGESQIYRAKRLSDGAMLLAKVYTTRLGGPKKRKEREEIRKKILKMEDPVSCGLLPLLDILRIKNSMEDSADVDIIPFCENGKLETANYPLLRAWVIPCLLKALNYLHENDWVHRDVKPENIYVAERPGGKTVVLGDFGTIVKTSEDKNVTNQTEIKRGTPGYTAREIRSGYWKKASDYFSLGCTIATLYNRGKHVYAALLDDGNDGAFYDKLKTVGLPLNCPDREADLQILVDALTLDDENARAGYHDVVQWLKDPGEFVKKWRSCRRGTGPEFKMRFEEHDYFSEKDLTEAFLQNWDAALDFFYEDDMFVGYIKANGHAGCNELQHILRDPPRNKLEKESGFARFLHFFNKLDEYIKPPIYWRSRKYNALSEIPAAVREGKGEITAEVLDLLRSGFLSWKYAISEPEDRETLETLKGIEKYIKTQPVLALETFVFLVDGNAKPEERSTEQVVWGVLSNRELFYKFCAAYCEEKNNLQVRAEVFSAVIAPLVQKGHAADIFGLADAFAREPDRIKRVIAAYLTFEKICTDKRPVRCCFFERGPYAHLYWLSKNIDLYEASSDQMQETAFKIKSFTVPMRNFRRGARVFGDAMPISEQLDSFASLKALGEEFRDNLQPLLANTLLDDMGQKTVKAKTLDAIFIAWGGDWLDQLLLSESVTPVGFIRAMGRIPPKDLIEDTIAKILYEAAVMAVPSSDDHVERACERITNGLSRAFVMYCNNEMAGGDVVQYAIDTVNNTKSGASQFGKVVAGTASPAYFHMYLYNIINSALQRFLKKPALEKWDELGKKCKEACDSEYHRQLTSHGIPYDVLAARCPDDYRPIWFALKDKAADFDVDRLIERELKLRGAKNKFDREKRGFELKVEGIRAKKAAKITRYDFIEIVSAADSAGAAWKELKKAFDSYNERLLPEFNAARAKAGGAASALLATWERYTASVNQYKTTDYEEEAAYWKGQRWEAEGLCRYCGGKLSLFGKCKSCGGKTS